MPKIKLQSSEGEIFPVDIDVAKGFGIIKSMFDDMGVEEDDDPIPLPNVNSKILEKVILFLTHHKNDVPVNDMDKGRKHCDNISSWDADFFNVDQGTLFELTLAANFLDVKGLLDAACKTLTNMIKGKTSEEIRKSFNIKNFKPAEEE